MWQLYKEKHDVEGATYNAWGFGEDTDLLARLVVSGEKTATASLHVLYELENEAIPKVGEYNVVLDSLGEATCIIQTTSVSIVPFNQVGEQHAFKEGEGDKTLDYWRLCHREFFEQCLTASNIAFLEDMDVVCEVFKLVFKASASYD